MNRICYPLFLFFFGAFLLMGCNETANNALEEDPDLIVEEIAVDENNDFLYDTGLDDIAEENMYNGFSSYGRLPGNQPTIDDSTIRFGRKINRRGIRRVSVERISPDTLLVRAQRQLAGFFYVFNKVDSSDVWNAFRKPLQHKIDRAAIYVKRDSSNATDRHNWQLNSVTLARGNSQPTATIRIQKVSVFRRSSGDTLVFQNPLDTYISAENIPTFTSGEPILVRVYLSNATNNPIDPYMTGATETLLLHYGAHRGGKVRVPFTFAGVDRETGLQVYEGSWTVHETRGRVHQAIIDAIDNGTIYESNNEDFPYNASHWSIPYRVIQ